MPPKLDAAAETVRLQLAVTTNWLARIDEWRAIQRPMIPNRSEAIRLLVDKALDAD